MADVERQAQIGAEILAALNSPGKDIPFRLWEAVMGHAAAVVERMKADDAVRDAETHLKAATSAGLANLIDGAQQGLLLARERQRDTTYFEHLLAGGLEAIRARVQLIDASHRRAADMSTMQKGK